MADESRPFPPSDHRRRELRRLGIVPYSPAFTALGALAGLIFGIALVGRRLHAAPLFSPALVFEAEPREIVGRGLELAALAVLPIAVGVLLFGLLQTRFLVAAPARVPKPRATGGVMAAIVWTAVFGVLALGLLSLVGARAGELYDAVRRGGLLQAAQAAEPLIRVVVVLLATGFLLGVLGRFTAVLAFRWRHSMSRLEVEAEARELEAKPEVKQARSRFSQEVL